MSQIFLRLLNLSQGVQTMLEAGDLEMGHARALLPLSETVQLKPLRMCCGLSYL